MGSTLKTVLLTEFNPNQIENLIKALATHFKLIFPDAAQTARHCWGIVGEKLEESDANALSNTLTALNLAHQIVSTEALPLFPPPKDVREFTYNSEKISLMELGRPRQEFLWNSLTLLSLCLYQATTQKITKKETGPSQNEKMVKTALLLATGIPLPMGKKESINVKTTSTELSYFVDLYLGEPLQRVRVEGNNLNYSFLGNRVESNSFANFRLFINDLTTHAPSARHNHGMKIFLKNEPVTAMKYDSPADLDKESRRLLALI